MLARRVRAVVFAVLLGLYAAVTSAGAATLRVDGTYYRAGRDRITHHFRFYADGTVISAATPEHHTPAQIARWFQRDWPVAAKGRYSVRGNRLHLRFQTGNYGLLPKMVQQKVLPSHAYSGVIGADHLVLRRDGRGEEKRFDFAKGR